jgi:hypothetical protein
LDNTILLLAKATLANATILPICNNASFHHLAGSFGVRRLARIIHRCRILAVGMGARDAPVGGAWGAVVRGLRVVGCGLGLGHAAPSVRAAAWSCARRGAPSCAGRDRRSAGRS